MCSVLQDAEKNGCKRASNWRWPLDSDEPCLSCFLFQQSFVSGRWLFNYRGSLCWQPWSRGMERLIQINGSPASPVARGSLLPEDCRLFCLDAVVFCFAVLRWFRPGPVYPRVECFCLNSWAAYGRVRRGKSECIWLTGWVWTRLWLHACTVSLSTCIARQPLLACEVCFSHWSE